MVEPHPTRTWPALTLVAATQLMVTLDGTLATIALPYVGADLGIATADLTWIISGYALAFGALLLLGGRLGDLYGFRRVLLAGLGVFAAATAVRTLTPDATVLFAARGVQGLGAALVAPSVLALIATTFPAGPARSRGYAMYAATSAAGAGVGMVVGGLLTGLDAPFGIPGWRIAFAVNVPVAILLAVAAHRILPESRPAAGRLDVPGALTAVLGLTGVVLGLTRAGTAGWSDPVTVASLGLGAGLLAAFVAIESRVAHPLLPLRLLRDRARGAGLLALMLAMSANFAMVYFLTQFLQRIAGWSPLAAGLAFLPMSLGIVLGARLAGRLSARMDPRRLAGAGTLLSAVALAGLSRLRIDDGPAAAVRAVTGGAATGAGLDYATAVAPYLTAVAIGMGTTVAALTTTALRGVRSEDAGVASAVVTTVQQVGGAIGLALLGTVSARVSDARADLVRGPVAAALPGDPGAQARAVFRATFTAGMTQAFAVAAGLMLVASLLVWTLVRARDTAGSPHRRPCVARTRRGRRPAGTTARRGTGRRPAAPGAGGRSRPAPMSPDRRAGLHR